MVAWHLVKVISSNFTKSIYFSLVLIFGSQLYAQTANEIPQVNFPDHYSASIDLVYHKVENWKGRMDIYRPKTTTVATPLIVNIHGGGWNHGTKESQSGFGSFFKSGYAVANVEYRLVDVATAPAAIEDVRCALIYLFNHAKELNIDTTKIVLMGGSAGGHLALMAGLLGDNTQFDGVCEYDGEIKVAAIINKYGVTDLIPLHKWKSAKRWLGKEYGNEDFVKSVSPIYHINKNSPPVFIVHGNSDPIVPYSQSEELNKKLVSLGVKTKFVTIQDGKHGKFTEEEKKDINKQMWDFLKELGL